MSHSDDPISDPEKEDIGAQSEGKGFSAVTSGVARREIDKPWSAAGTGSERGGSGLGEAPPSLLRKERRELLEDFGHDVSGEPTDAFSVPRPPVETLHLV